MGTTKLGILIEALYRGAGARQATKDMGALGKATKGASANMFAARARSEKLSDAQNRLAARVKSGGLSATKAGAIFDRYKRQLPTAETEEASKQSVGMKDALGHVAIAAGVAGAALYAAKKAFDLGAEGAQIMRTRDAFDRLAESVGSTADIMLTKMRDATAGMVSDTDLMQSASRMLSMGLANTADEAAELSEVAVLLGSAMGKGPTEAMEEFALTLANQSTPRLDTFGISAGAVKERIRELREEFPEMSRETAFMRATMEQAEIAMERLGGELKPDAYSQASAEIANMTDEFKILVSQALAPAIKALGGFFRELREGREEIGRIEEASKALAAVARAAGITEEQQSDLLDTVIELSKGMRDADTIMRRERIGYDLLAKGIAKTTDEAGEMAVAQDKVNEAMRNSRSYVEDATDAQEELTDSTEDATDATNDLADATEEATDMAQRYADAASEHISMQTRLGLKIQDTRGEQKKLRDEFRFSEGQIKSFYESWHAGALNMADIPEKAVNDVIAFRNAVNAAKNAILGISETSEEKKRAMLELWLDAQEEAKKLAKETYAAGKAIEDEADNIAGYWDPVDQMLEDMNAEYDEMDGRTVEVTFHSNFTGTPPAWYGGAPGGDPTRPPGGRGGEQRQHGGQFIVPPGYQNDRYPVWTTSGERVTVETKTQQQQGGMAGGGSVIVNLIGSGSSMADADRIANIAADKLGVRG